MPVLKNAAQFSKRRLKSELIPRSVELPPAESEKKVYLEVYMKRVGNKNSADFSSDEEELFQTGHEEKEARRKHSDMVDLSSLTDDQLRCKLLQYGVKPGPIVASTRMLYERRLHRLMAQHSRHTVNNKHDFGKYSDSDEEGGQEMSGLKQPTKLGSLTVSHTDLGERSSTVWLNHQSKDKNYPQCFFPPAKEGKNQEESLESLDNSSLSFSITQLVEEGSVCLSIENRLSPQPKSAETERSHSYTPVASRAQREAVTDVLKEMFPDTALTPTGISATKRRSIKGAAGRPVQYKYPETPLSPSTLERLEIQQRLVPLWVQIAVFVLAATVLYLIYISMEEPLENPFNTFVHTPRQELSSDDLALVPDSESVHT
ncbi:LEM domain-containing protein 1 isoform X3 [Clarias gariepinus]|uniref:LEM domain-containing protein 1 isoform X3 n=1 Tax=Clarias gariepinus TaxID=13013 RepID=UPI00234DC1F1|nr:LEM domain-containing protein 1 isoform X3 [Clarias gariepinus]